MARKNELSSREDFLIEQFADMRNINKFARKLYSVYYLDIDHFHELTPMERMIVPSYWIDPQNPEHPSAYILAGQSMVTFIERISYVYPYVSGKKYAYDLSAWQGSLINSQEFFDTTKDYRKTKLDPIVVEDKKDSDTKYIHMKEKDAGIKIPIPAIVSKEECNDQGIGYYDEIYLTMYRQFYRYLPKYLNSQKINYKEIGEEDILDLLDSRCISAYTPEGDEVSLTRDLFPNLKKSNNKLFIGRVPDPLIEDQSEKWHYIIMEQQLNDDGAPYFVTYTLVAAIQL